MNEVKLKDFYKEFPTEEACLRYLEQVRWPSDRTCPHCGSTESYKFRDGRLLKCKACKRQFTAKVGTLFTGSHVPLQEWFLAIHLLASQEGVSSIRLAEALEVTQKTAWLMMKRISHKLEGDKPHKAEASFGDVLKKLVSPTEPAKTQ